MRTYSKIALVVNGKETDYLDIYKEHNTFAVYRNDLNIFTGTYSELQNFITEWENKNSDIVNFMTSQGMEVEYIRNGI